LYLTGNEIFNDGTRKILFNNGGVLLYGASGRLTLTSTDTSIADGDETNQIVFTNDDSANNVAEINIVATEAHQEDAKGGVKYQFKAHSNATDVTDDDAMVNIMELNAGDGISLNLPVTASGDISSSGNYIGNRRFDVTSTTDADHQGDIVFIGNTTTNNGKIYHFKSDGSWEIADADAASTSDGLLAVALGSNSTNDGMLLRGMVTLDHDPGAVGDVLFLETGASGHATATAPNGGGDIIRVIGYCLDASNGQIWFNPSSTFVEHS